ncbi:MAG: hypothetical protein ABI718_08850 [Acidobacteriota bacterium]
MTRTPCELFAENPEAHADHAAACPDCARLMARLDRLDRVISDEAVDPAPGGSRLTSNLPLAPWEGANLSSWPLAAAGALAIVLVSSVLFMMAGVSPVGGLAAAFRSEVPGIGLFRAASIAGETMQQAPARFQALLLSAFVLVNVLFVFLLRRAPRGVDVTSR